MAKIFFIVKGETCELKRIDKKQSKFFCGQYESDDINESHFCTYFETALEDKAGIPKRCPECIKRFGK